MFRTLLAAALRPAHRRLYRAAIRLAPAHALRAALDDRHANHRDHRDVVFLHVVLMRELKRRGLSAYGPDPRYPPP